MVLQPFAAAAILARTWSWLLIPALGAVLAVFVLREALMVLARQKWLWREARPETAAARRSLFVESLVLAACATTLWLGLPGLPLIALGLVAAAMTAIAVYLTLNNRQRSVTLQIASAFGLSSSGLLAALAATGELRPWVWMLWLVLALHSLAGIYVVHARLDAMMAARNPDRLPAQAARMRITAKTVQVVQLLAAVPVALLLPRRLIWPMLFSSTVNLIELDRLREPRGLREPLRRVGFRTLGLSILHSALSVVVLWQSVF